MNKKTVKELICDRYWEYRHYTEKNDSVAIFLKKDSLRAYFLIQFGQDGRILFPGAVPFKPNEYSMWDFDEEEQKIVILDKNGNENQRVDIPIEWINGIQRIFLTGEAKGDALVCEKSTNKRKSHPYFLGGTQVFITSRKFVTLDLIHDLSRLGFNIKISNHQVTSYNFFSDTFEYIIQHPQLQKIIISNTGKLEVKLPQNHQLLISKDCGPSSIAYLTGNRAPILELLSSVLMENNQHLLNSEDNRAEEEIFQAVLQTQFSDRYELG